VGEKWKRIFESMIKILLGLLTLLAGTVHAQTEVTSPNYIIQLPGFNSGAGIPVSTHYSISSTIGQTTQGIASSSGYLVRSGFQYIYSIIPFSFSISSISINFGNLLAQSPVPISETLTVSSGGAGGYQVKASENHPLKASSSAATIPDTSCDTSCDETTAAAWILNTKYGFGFNMSGDDIPTGPTGFAGLTYYRQFADRSISEVPQIVMSSIYVGKSRQSTVTYKVNIAGTQPAGVYNNVIEYTALPSY
jgi:hypothetical protein